MTNGNIYKALIKYAIPLLLGNILQQLYSTVDSIICGNYIGSLALASIGSSEPIINLVTGLFFGFSAGVSILIGHYFGEQNDKKISELINNAITLTVVTGIVFTVIGILIVPVILNFIHTPDNIFVLSKTYLSIYFSGMIFVMIYNMISGILRGMGNTKTPLYLLCITSGVNIVLDLLFIIVFKWGIAGAALATIIAQAISAFLSLIILVKLPYAINIKKPAFNKALFIEICKIALPTAIGGIIIDFSNVLVQSYINAFGSDAIAGINTYFRYDLFILMPSKSFGYAIETFVAQNLGAKQYDRIKDGLKACLTLAVTSIIGLSVFTYYCGYYFLYLFNQEEQVLYYGNFVLKQFVFYYPFLTINHTFCGLLRGAKKALATNVINICSMCLFRQIILFVGTKLSTSILVIVFGYGLTWIASALATSLYGYFKVIKNTPSEYMALQ